MDPLTQTLSHPKAQEAFLLHVLMSPPWSIDVEDEAPLSLVPVLSGQVNLTVNDVVTPLQPGDVLVVRSPTAYRLSSANGTSARRTALIGADQACSGPDGRDLSAELHTGVRTWGNDALGEDRMLVGSYRYGGQVGQILLESLPSHFVVRDPAPAVVALLTGEVATDRLGQTSTLDRLLDVLLVSTLRTWITSRDDGSSPSWLRAAADPQISRVMTAVHGDPARRWTAEDLAAEVGMSRASLNRRFTEVVGVAPMTYVTRCRLALAADLLRDSQTTLAAIARRTGYATPFSLSAAFKKHHGVSPQAYRKLA